jgi:rhodanese-related sulfurtransferase
MNQTDCAEIRAMLARGAHFVDVRTPMEFWQGAVDGAVNLPLQSLQRAREVLDPNRPVLVYCRSGSRSAYARNWLLAMGFAEVVDVGAPHRFVHCLDAAQPGPRFAYAV